MSDGAYAVLLFTGLLSGPAAAFMVRIVLLPVFVLFPFSALASCDGRAFLRIAVLAFVPAGTLAWAVWSGNARLAEGSARWLAAVACGSSLAVALGSSRAAAILFEASRRVRSAGLLESLSMVLALAGPFSDGVRRNFRKSRREGAGIGRSVTNALSGLEDIALPGAPGLAGTRNAVQLGAAVAAWILFTASLAGLA
jgi:hypothetical protein